MLIILLILPFLLATPLEGAKKKKELPPGGEAGLRLLAMQKKGIIELALVEPSPLLYVEPLYWQRMTHKQKEHLGWLALEFVSGLNKEQGKKYLFVFIKNMTSHEKLGTVYLDENRVEITK